MAAIQNPNQDLTTQFEKDWNQAQQSYRAGLDAGFSQSDAEQAYLSPVIQKWKIVGASPSLQTDPERLGRFSNDFTNANNSFLTNRNAYSLDNGEDVASRSIVPTLQKWAIEGKLPEAERKITASDAALANKLPENVIKEALLTNPPLGIDPATTDGGRFQGEKFKLMMEPDVATKLQNYYTDLIRQGIDPATAQQQAKVNTLGKNWTIQPNLVTNTPAVPAKAKATFFGHGIPFTGTAAVPADVSTNSFRIQPNLEPVPIVQTKNIRDKVTLANSLAKQHPDWTKAQIIKAVNGSK